MIGQLFRNVCMFCGTLKHHVFQQMRHAGFAVPFHTRAYQVSDVDGNGLFGRIGEKQDAKPVIQPVLRDALH